MGVKVEETVVRPIVGTVEEGDREKLAIFVGDGDIFTQTFPTINEEHGPRLKG